MNAESEVELDELEVLRERLKRDTDALEAGKAEIIKLAPGTVADDVAESIRDRIAIITATLNRNGRA